MVTHLYRDCLCQVSGQTKEKTKAFKCVSYLDRSIFRTNVKGEARRWLIMMPQNPSKDLSHQRLHILHLGFYTQKTPMQHQLKSLIYNYKMVQFCKLVQNFPKKDYPLFAIKDILLHRRRKFKQQNPFHEMIC